MLLLLVSLALSGGVIVAAWALHWGRRRAGRAPLARARKTPQFAPLPVYRASVLDRPQTWLAVRGRNLLAVQLALGLHNPKPCTWMEGLAGEQKLFIAPAVKGWILVIGSGLPEPNDDIDTCFRFIVELSRKLGHVQFFNSNRVLGHHAWVQAHSGRIDRAYAWAGKTLWNQGIKTAAELELGLKCFQYFEDSHRAFGEPDTAGINTEKVPMLAARWSLDPAGVDDQLIEQSLGISGEPSRIY
jgi:hypothetical protein